jgi:patatin-like phospholipase/acyl hydrolase
MKDIRRHEKLAQVPLPCQYFDLIGGTSTGGLIAIMLGRLRMVRLPGTVVTANGLVCGEMY